MIITKDGQEDRPLSAAFVELLQNSVGQSARERQKRALTDLAPVTNGTDEGTTVLPSVSSNCVWTLHRRLCNTAAACQRIAAWLAVEEEARVTAEG